MKVAVQPLPSTKSSEERAATAALPVLYQDDSVECLPTIDPTRTLVAVLLGRRDDEAFNARVIAATRRFNVALHVVSTAFCSLSLAGIFIVDLQTRNSVSSMVACLGLIHFVVVVGSLSWDLLALLVRQFDFWYLQCLNAMNGILWMILFHDHRAIAHLATSSNFGALLISDANIYTRRFVTRVNTFAAPALFASLAATALRIPPDLNYPTFRVCGLSFDAVDLLVNGSLIITYFTALRVHRSNHLVFSNGPIHQVECETYYPVCHLVPQNQRRRCSLQHQATKTRTRTQFSLLEHPSDRGIDLSQTIFPRFARCLARLTGKIVLRILSFLSIAASAVSLVVITREMSVVVVHWAHLQPRLVNRIAHELDAWFVSLQMSMVNGGVCDLFRWEPPVVMLMVSLWLWAHWIILLDALLSQRRQTLGVSRRLPQLLALFLLGYPPLISYWLYFSPAQHGLQDRVIYSVVLNHSRMTLTMRSFVGSKLLTLWLWVARFFWRELVRPSDSFKLIKRRVFYRVDAWSNIAASQSTSRSTGSIDDG